MEELISAEQKPAYIGLPLRITFAGSDHELRLLQKEVDRYAHTLRIRLDDEPHILVNSGDGWRFESGADNAAFAQAIWHAVSLRYRL
ncbi:hypothetical protein GCM10007415_22190 [Parapedobacter pyrenivorans]|uniref:Uncharacterized protein n=1 Tax=Parapedobacter pyrenivorans TaxID=1305674 RepID=A0A917MAF5_9SPHI|nr:hypothetical protein [Parapedobacter pyrenivorans]GGG87831.1 hypothetical protein GCM10007415_22190 [Parapedobacter pyrenivorans]